MEFEIEDRPISHERRHAAALASFQRQRFADGRLEKFRRDRALAIPEQESCS